MSLTHVLLYIKIVNPTLCTFIKGLNSGMEAALSRPLGYNQREGGQQEVESKPLQPHLCVCVCVSGSGNGQQGGGMWNISDAGPEAVYTVSQPVTSESRLYKCQQTQDGAVSKQLHRSHHTVTQVSETDWAPSATRAHMDRLLCDCVIALAVLLCVATQVRPAPAYLQ